VSVLFDECGVCSVERLEELLAEEHEPRGLTRPAHLSSFLPRLCELLSRLIAPQDPLPEGVHQFSLAKAPCPPEEDVRRALFLARRSTIITNASLRNFWGRWVRENGSTFDYSNWHIEDDYVRALVTYRDVLATSALDVMPDHLLVEETTLDGHRYANEPWPAIPQEHTLLERVSASRVVGVRADPALIEAVLRSYQARRQIVELGALEIPWVNNLGIDEVMRLRGDSGDELAVFQRAYHSGLQTCIENLQSLDFLRLSREVNADIIYPALRALDRKYQRAIELHRSLRQIGAAVAVLPLTSVFVSGTMFRQPMIQQLVGAGATTLATLAGLAVNRAQHRSAVAALGEETYFILWNLEASRPGGPAHHLGPLR
jgi:hypothetical protein